ncbi:hypothetical protein [Azospirillum sp. B510]|uniref:hypothetical protein n=1 Tax=Azospirillum sp. (strain B510) TaxID=137722 RepID=UPI0011D05BDA|nr:hypothetical protein [Azospirillum sp. B510]
MTSSNSQYPNAIAIDAGSVIGDLEIKIGILEYNDGYAYPQFSNNGQIQISVSNGRVDTGSCGILIPIDNIFKGGSKYQNYINIARAAMQYGANELKNGLNSSIVQTAINNAFSVCESNNAFLSGVSYIPNSFTELAYQPSNDVVFHGSFLVNDIGIGLVGNDLPLAVAQNVVIMGGITGDVMVGVGFDRALMGDNPFLANIYNPNDMNDALYPSYCITAAVGGTGGRNQIYLGANPNDGDFNFQILGNNIHGNAYQNSSWQSPSGYIEWSNSNGISENSICSLIVDTGINPMLIKNIQDFPDPESVNSQFNLNVRMDDSSGSGKYILNYNIDVTGSGYANLRSGTNDCVPVFKTNLSKTFYDSYSPNNEAIYRNDGTNDNSNSPTLIDVIFNSAPNDSNNNGRPFVNMGFNPLMNHDMIFDALNNSVGFGAYTPNSQ